MTKHNKKRNVGIVYELLLNYVTRNLVEGNQVKAKKATKIIEKHFQKGTELYREFRLFNALSKTKVTNTHIVASILNEAKMASRNFDNKLLEKEKSFLIKSINYTLADKSFFYQAVDNYRELGTVQLALNEWRNTSPDIKKLIDYEVKIGEIMLREEVENIVQTDDEASHSDRLVLKIMTEKFNKKYGGLSTDQKIIIENYVFYQNKNHEFLCEFFNNKKKEALNRISLFETMSDDKYILSKLDSVRLKITEVNTSVINDESVLKLLSLTQLIHEFNKGDGNAER
tara:strand:- start:1566 stop:2420 length:855 start_codon:yes stop_codon:yes gene_type:complete